MAVSICRELPCSILIVLIYYVRESDIRVKRYRHLNFSRSSVVQFWACQYIMVSIIHSSENLWPFEFAESFRVQFWGSRYIMGIDHTIESKVMAIWICWELPYSMSRVSIYDACESDIRVKSYSYFEFVESFCCSILSVLIYLGRQSYIGVKSYARLYLPSVSLFSFVGLDIWCMWIGHPSEKL